MMGDKKKGVILPTTTAVTLKISTVPVAAQSEDTTGACGGNVPEVFQDIVELLTRIQELGIALGLSIASIMLIWAGILWMRGRPEDQKRAKRIATNTLFGLVIILSAGALVEFVKQVLCG